ncbi:MAG: chorismate mutase, partial [Paracoccaceae bacterium]
MSDDVAAQDDAARAQKILAGLRNDIDNLDAVLVYTLAQRFKATKAVGVLKARHSLAPSDPAREDQQIARLQSLCEDSGLDPEFAK